MPACPAEKEAAEPPWLVLGEGLLQERLLCRRLLLAELKLHALCNTEAVRSCFRASLWDESRRAAPYFLKQQESSRRNVLAKEHLAGLWQFASEHPEVPCSAASIFACCRLQRTEAQRGHSALLLISVYSAGMHNVLCTDLPQLQVESFSFCFGRVQSARLALASRNAPGKQRLSV